MTKPATSVLDPSASSAPVPTKIVSPPAEVVDNVIQLRPRRVYEMSAVAAQERERTAELWTVLLLSLSLLALFVVTFVAYLILDAAHLL